MPAARRPRTARAGRRSCSGIYRRPQSPSPTSSDEPVRTRRARLRQPREGSAYTVHGTECRATECATATGYCVPCTAYLTLLSASPVASAPGEEQRCATLPALTQPGSPEKTNNRCVNHAATHSVSTNEARPWQNSTSPRKSWMSRPDDVEEA